MIFYDFWWSLITHLNSLEESPIVILHQPAVQHNLQTTFCKSGNSETGVNIEYIICRELFVKSRFEKNWIYHFLSVFVYEVLNLIPNHTKDLERIKNVTFVCHYAEDNKILTLASIWPLAPLVPPNGWLDTKESLAVKVFVESQTRIWCLLYESTCMKNDHLDSASCTYPKLGRG